MNLEWDLCRHIVGFVVREIGVARMLPRIVVVIVIGWPTGWPMGWPMGLPMGWTRKEELECLSLYLFLFFYLRARVVGLLFK